MRSSWTGKATFTSWALPDWLNGRETVAALRTNVIASESSSDKALYPSIAGADRVNDDADKRADSKTEYQDQRCKLFVLEKTGDEPRYAHPQSRARNQRGSHLAANKERQNQYDPIANPKPGCGRRQRESSDIHFGMTKCD
jgi:hypothetical protein